MAIYFGVVKEGISFDRVEKQLSEAGIVIRHYSRSLKVVEFETEGEIPEAGLDLFLAIEEERDDFSVQM